MLRPPSPGSYAGLAAQIAFDQRHRPEALVQPYNVPPNWMGHVSGTPALPWQLEAGAPSGAFLQATREIATAEGVNFAALGPNDHERLNVFWAPVTSMGPEYSLAALREEFRAVDRSVPVFRGRLATLVGAWFAMNVAPLAGQLMSCVPAAEVETVQTFLLAWMQEHGQPEIVEGSPWPVDVRDSVRAALVELCDVQPDLGTQAPLPVVIPPAPTFKPAAAEDDDKDKGPSTGVIVAGVAVLGIVGGALYLQTRKGARGRRR